MHLDEHVLALHRYTQNVWDREQNVGAEGLGWGKRSHLSWRHWMKIMALGGAFPRLWKLSNCQQGPPKKRGWVRLPRPINGMWPQYGYLRWLWWLLKCFSNACFLLTPHLSITRQRQQLWDAQAPELGRESSNSSSENLWVGAGAWRKTELGSQEGEQPRKNPEMAVLIGIGGLEMANALAGERTPGSQSQWRVLLYTASHSWENLMHGFLILISILLLTTALKFKL